MSKTIFVKYSQLSIASVVRLLVMLDDIAGLVAVAAAVRIVAAVSVVRIAVPVAAVEALWAAPAVCPSARKKFTFLETTTLTGNFYDDCIDYHLSTSQVLVMHTLSKTLSKRETMHVS